MLVSWQLTGSLWLDWLMPHLVLALVMATALSGDWQSSLFSATLGGLWLDMVSGSLIGLQLILLALVAYSISLLNRQVFQQPGYAVALFLFWVMASLFELIVNLVVGQLTWQFILTALLTALLATAFYQLLRLLTKRREVIRLA